MNSSPHLAELLLAAKLRGKRDPLRHGKGGFSDDIVQVNAVLNTPKVTRLRKIAAYRKWLAGEGNQPCAFGRSAAGKDRVFICLLEERQIFNMRRGDDDLRDTLRDHQRVWKRRALHGLSSSLVIVVTSPLLAELAPGPELKEICRRLMELYVEASVPDDEILPQKEYVYLRKESPGAKPRFIKFSTLPNIFCAQADRRWWHDHRTPGALMITSNALGHYMHTISSTGEPDCKKAISMALLTIKNAHELRTKPKGFRATELVPRPSDEPTPMTAEGLSSVSARRYAGYFHTDHLIPSVFFDGKHPTKRYDDLDFSYIHDKSVPDHAELMQGIETDWYTVQKEVWTKDGEHLKPDCEFDVKERGRSFQWLEKRLALRCT